MTTDGQGQYRIVDLRPGTYVVTFTLPGFQTFKREGLELPSNFTATVNADLKVGALEESVTVSGSSPVVDVNTNVKAQVLPRDVLDAVPTARTIQGLGQLVVGVNLSSPDVGGSRAMQQTYFAVHGVGASGTMVTVDGLITNGTMGDGAVQAYHNEAMIQEAVYQTAGGSAETITGGLNMNLVPKDGGNRFSGGTKATKSPKQWQGDNLSDDLKSLGVVGVDKIDELLRVQRRAGRPDPERQAVVLHRVPARSLRQADCQHVLYACRRALSRRLHAFCASKPGTCEQGISDEKMDNPIARLTWQVSPKNKLAVFNDRAMRLRGHAMTALTDPATASFVWHTPTFATGSAKWTSTVSPRLLLEGGLLVQPRALRHAVSGRHRRRARHSSLVCRRPQERHQHRFHLQLGRRAAWKLPGPLQPRRVRFLRYWFAQHQGRIPGLVRPLPPLQHGQRRSLSDLHQRRRRPGNPAEHVARGR